MVAADPSNDVLNFLDSTIDSYSRTIAFTQVPCNTEEVLYRDAVRQNALQVLQLGFVFGRANAVLLASTKDGATTRSRPLAKPRAVFPQSIAKTTAQIADIQGQLDASGPGESRPPPRSRSFPPSTTSWPRMNIAGPRLKVLQDYQKFSSETGQSNESLDQKIDDLERAVPEAAPGGTAPSPLRR